MKDSTKKYVLIGSAVAIIIGLTVITCKPKKNTEQPADSAIVDNDNNKDSNKIENNKSESNQDDNNASNNNSSSESSGNSASYDDSKMEEIYNLMNEDPNKFQDEYDNLSSDEKEYFSENYMKPSAAPSKDVMGADLSELITDETVQKAYISEDSQKFESYIENIEDNAGLSNTSGNRILTFEEAWGSTDEDYVMNCWEYDSSLQDVYYFTAYPMLEKSITINGTEFEANTTGTETAFVEIKDGEYKIKYLTWCPLNGTAQDTLVMLTDNTKNPAEWYMLQQELEIAYNNNNN